MTANVIVWASILQWLAIAGVFAFDATRAYVRSRRQHKAALSVGNGRVLVAMRRKGIAAWIIVGSYIAFSLGLLSVYSNGFLPHPPPDTRIAGVVIREGIVIMLFAFWRATRTSVLLQTEADTRHGQMKTIQTTVEDTNAKVTEMQERGQSDRPEERQDRAEGVRHRGSVEERLDEQDARMDASDERENESREQP